MPDLKKIFLSVHDFAMPAPRSGSIEANSGYSHNSTQKGIELHQLIQKKRKAEHDHYAAEVKIIQELERGEYLFVVEGRMDGLFRGEVPVIEEIKSCFNLYDLKKNLKDKHFSHPYVLQLHAYGYFHWLQNQVKPELILHLISSRTHEEVDLAYELDVDLFEEWLNRRLDELVIDARRAEKRTIRRKKIAESFPFPFAQPRRGQKELVGCIEEGMKTASPMLLQAPTGLGKTMGVLYPAMKNALARGQKVIYVTPKNSQQRVAEEAVEKFQDQGSEVKSLTLTAKSKLCMKAEPLCDPGYCEYALDYYDKIEQHGLKDVLMKKKKISSRIIKNLAEKFKVCPFELQLEAIEEMDAVICDYNYVFANRSALGKLPAIGFEETGKPNLVIDEAHNLPSRAMGYYSPVLSSFMLEKMRGELEDLPKKFAQTGISILDEGLSVIRAHAPKSGKSETIELQLESFIAVEEDLRNFLSKYLDSDIEIKAKDVVMRFVFYWTEFTDILRQILDVKRPEFFTSYHFEQSGGAIKITCCDASEMLKPRYEKYEQVIAFSATLKPFEYYAKLSGLASDKLITAEFESPFERENRKILLIPQISTKFSERERNYSRIAETIGRLVELKQGNYLAFFPSFDFMEKTSAHLRVPAGMKVVKQNRYMKNDDVEKIIEDLKAAGAPTLVMGVQGGHFSEGVDYPGEMVIGAFVVGPPLPNFDFERESMKAYYEECYQKGHDYAYTYPAMAKAIQAAGRVIRTESDRGLIVLMDGRFLDKTYSQTMPADWFEESPRELVSTSILKDVNEFWTAKEVEVCRQES